MKQYYLDKFEQKLKNKGKYLQRELMLKMQIKIIFPKELSVLNQHPAVYIGAALLHHLHKNKDKDPTAYIGLAILHHPQKTKTKTKALLFKLVQPFSITLQQPGWFPMLCQIVSHSVLCPNVSSFL